jgi:tellurite resistance protein
MADFVLDDELAQLYAAALYSITRADGAVDREEGDALRELIARRWQLTIDPEALFFTTVTPESFAHAVARRDPFRGSASPAPRLIAHTLIADALELSVTTGGLDDDKARAILRFARALGYTTDDVRAATDQLSRWLEP